MEGRGERRLILRRMLGGGMSKIESDYEWLSFRVYRFKIERWVSREGFLH